MAAMVSLLTFGTCVLPHATVKVTGAKIIQCNTITDKYRWGSLKFHSGVVSLTNLIDFHQSRSHVMSTTSILECNYDTAGHVRNH